MQKTTKCEITSLKESHNNTKPKIEILLKVTNQVKNSIMSTFLFLVTFSLMFYSICI